MSIIFIKKKLAIIIIKSMNLTNEQKLKFNDSLFYKPILHQVTTIKHLIKKYNIDCLRYSILFFFKKMILIFLKENFRMSNVEGKK